MRKYTLITPENEGHWLDLRTKDVTSTESSALFGLSPYMTELELYYRKLSGETVKFQDNFRMKAGRILEPAIAKIAASELNCTAIPFKEYATDFSVRMGSSFDYRITHGKYAGWILEIKNVDYMIYKSHWQDDEAPEHIEVQVQHQLELTQKPGCIIAALVGGNDLKLIFRERDEEVGRGIRNRIKRFWDDIDNHREPKPDFEKDSDFIISLHQNANDKIYDASGDAALETLIVDYLKYKNEAKDKEERAKASKAKILSLVEDANKVIANGYVINCGMTKTTPPKVITEDMVGQEIGGRKGFRNFKLREVKK